MKHFITLCFVLLWISANADYLITSRSANIKAEPNSTSGTIEKVDSGIKLTLLDNGRQEGNGYYKVTAPNGNTGWIYRTLVRRYADTDNTDEPSVTSTVLPASAEDVEVTAIDVGAGLSCLIKLPGGKYIIYDGGKASGLAYLKKQLPANTKIELLILSHTDADHWGEVEGIINTFQVQKVVRTSYRVNAYSATYTNGVNAIENASYDIEDIDLSTSGDIVPGKVLFDKSGAKLTALCGFGKPLAEWGSLNEAKANNAVSIVVRLDYAGHSILFGGDAVGRDECNESNDCIATEKFLIEKAGNKLLDADILIVPHHGADNASCKTFIEKVSPEYVVFSAGHAFRHPREVTAERYISFGVDQDNIFRTDRGDLEEASGSEECKKEWSYGDGNETDNPGDDNVRMVLPKKGKVKVSYFQ